MKEKSQGNTFAFGQTVDDDELRQAIRDKNNRDEEEKKQISEKLTKIRQEMWESQKKTSCQMKVVSSSSSKNMGKEMDKNLSNNKSENSQNLAEEKILSSLDEATKQELSNILPPSKSLLNFLSVEQNQLLK